MVQVILKFKENYFLKCMTYAVTIALSVMLIAACGRPSQALPEIERENYERAIAGEEIECLHGLDANGNCRKEGDDGVPTGNYGCYPFCNKKPE